MYDCSYMGDRGRGEGWKGVESVIEGVESEMEGGIPESYMKGCGKAMEGVDRAMEAISTSSESLIGSDLFIILMKDVYNGSYDVITTTSLMTS